jgi:alkanesulfonate monooxygenase SsuD/methylene tetrahydromethanopterin reductase-like flavin-dependent oxidoreductase (luciferase family)
MDFGVMYELGVSLPRSVDSEREVYWNALEQVVQADRLGYSHVWAVEHHFLEGYSHSSAPEVWLSAVAQHTDRIRIGHGVVQVPAGFNHPVRTAERAAALDILSNGRLEFGTGRSITKEELEGFGIPVEDSRPMWREAIDLITKIWTTDGPIEYDGTYTTVPRRPIVPKPIQKPHPPLWSAATSPPSYALAGELGMGVLGFATGITSDVIARRIAEYKEALSRATPVGAINDNVATFMLTMCTKSDEEARKICEGPFAAYLDHTMEYFLHWGRGGELPPGYEWYAEASRHGDKLADHMKFDYLLENGVVLVGSPDTICANIKKFQDVGVTQIICGTQYPGISQDQALSSIQLFAEEVLPQFTDAQQALPAEGAGRAL